MHFGEKQKQNKQTIKKINENGWSIIYLKGISRELHQKKANTES